MPYNPGTLFSAYPKNDKTKCFKAVLLKNGKVLEFDSDTKLTSTYDSIKLWKEKHSDCYIKNDTPNSNGFNVPTNKDGAFGWVRWCYSMVKEAAPQLLISEEFKIAYNKMVEVCDKYKDEIYYHMNDESSPIYRYHINNIEISTGIKGVWPWPWCGFCGYFYKENTYRNGKLIGYSKEEYEIARKEIIEVYKPILDIIKPNIEKYMALKTQILETKNKIRKIERSVTHAEKRLHIIQNRIFEFKSSIINDYDNLAKFEEELLTI
jgi:hypothetical protein